MISLKCSVFLRNEWIKYVIINLTNWKIVFIRKKVRKYKKKQKKYKKIK